MIHYIYKIVNGVNGKIYIGYTSRTDPTKRWDIHLQDSKTLNRPLYQSMRKHGVDKFTFEVLYCSKEKDHTLGVMENYFIKEYHSHITEGRGYNITWGGQSNVGWVPSDKTRRLWSDQRRGRVFSKEIRESCSARMKQRYADHPELREHYRKIALERGIRPPTPTPESMRRGAETRRGKHIHTQERKQTLSEATKDPNHPFNREGIQHKRKQTWEKIGRGKGERNGRAVFCKIFNPEGELVGEGFLRKLCEENQWPFDKFLAAARHGKPLERGDWKGWRISRISRPDV